MPLAPFWFASFGVYFTRYGTRELAIQDRKSYPSPWRRPFHQRDLAVIRVLLELDISLDRAREELEIIHTHADTYEKYYANPREEVIWPGPDTF